MWKLNNSRRGKQQILWQRKQKVRAERAREYSLKDFDGYYTGREKAVEEGYIAGAGEQKHLILEAFDEWLCRNSWITRDEGNRKPLKELRNIIRNI